MSVFERTLTAIEEMAQTAGRNDKEAILKTFTPDMQKVWAYMLDPFKMYGLRAIPEVVVPHPATNEFSDDYIFEQLDAMASRKLSGDSARFMATEILTNSSEATAECFRRILLKDPRAGIGSSSTDKVFKGLVPKFDVMLAAPYNAKKLKLPALCQAKLDGVRVIVRVDLDTGVVEFLSRTGKELPALKGLTYDCYELARIFRSQHGWSVVILDGEAVTGDFAKTVSEARRKDVIADDAQIFLFDAISGNDFSERSNSEPCTLRYERLQACIALHHQEEPESRLKALKAIIANDDETIMHNYNLCRSRGLEGLIVKDAAAPYHFRRNAAWMKIKDQASEDLIIVDVLEGEGKYVNMLGALVVDYNGVRVRVGTGLTDADRDAIWKSHLDGKVIGRMVEVEYMEVTPDKSLRHPRFKGFRDTVERPGDKI